MFWFYPAWSSINIYCFIIISFSTLNSKTVIHGRTKHDNLVFWFHPAWSSVNIYAYNFVLNSKYKYGETYRRIKHNDLVFSFNLLVPHPLSTALSYFRFKFFIQIWWSIGVQHIDVAPITQTTHVRNENCNIQERAPNVVKVTHTKVTCP